MGEATAGALGVIPARTRRVLVLAAIALTAIATASAGPIAFIALAAPQLARRRPGQQDWRCCRRRLWGIVADAC